MTMDCADRIDEVKTRDYVWLKNFNPFKASRDDCAIRALSAALMMKYESVCRMLHVPFIKGVGRTEGVHIYNKIDKIEELREYIDFSFSENFDKWFFDVKRQILGPEAKNKDIKLASISVLDFIVWLQAQPTTRTRVFAVVSKNTENGQYHLVAIYKTRRQAYAVDSYDSTDFKVEDIIEIKKQVPADSPDRLRLSDFRNGYSDDAFFKNGLNGRTRNEVLAYCRQEYIDKDMYGSLPFHILGKYSRAGLPSRVLRMQLCHILGKHGVKTEMCIGRGSSMIGIYVLVDEKTIVGKYGIDKIPEEVYGFKMPGIVKFEKDLCNAVIHESPYFEDGVQDEMNDAVHAMFDSEKARWQAVEICLPTIKIVDGKIRLVVWML